jgi:hypothetical protein
MRRDASLYCLMLGFIITCLCLSGCAGGTSYVKLDYSPTPFSGEEITGRDTIIVEKAVDKREGFLEEEDYTGDQVGFKRNTYGMVTGSVRLPGGQKIQDLMTDAIGKLIRSKGFKTIPYDEGGSVPADETKEPTLALLRTEIVQFEVWFDQGFAALTAIGDGELNIGLYDPNEGRTIWEENILVNYEKGGIFTFTDEDYQDAAENTFKMLMDEIEKRLPWEKMKGESMK